MYDPLIFWENHAQAWLQKSQPTAEQWRWLKKFFKPDWKVLELGCGTGRWSEHIPNYTGVDISPTLVIEAQKLHPTKTFAHHDMRYPLPEGYDLIFTFTSWLHVSPGDIAKVQLPKTRYLFVEPNAKSEVEYCFTHNLRKLFKVNAKEKHDQLIVYANY